MSRPSLSVCFPVYNEEDNIERAVTETAAVLSELTDDWEIVAVDDASVDRTPVLLAELSVRHPQLRVITLPTNTKFAGALTRALKAAQMDYVFYTDSDNPIDMSELKRAVPLLSEADVVIGYRANRDEGLRRAVYSQGYNHLIRLFFSLRVNDVNFAFKLFRREVIQRADIRARGSFIDAELLLEAQRLGYRMKEIGVHYFPRTAGESTLASIPIAALCFGEMLQYRVRRPRSTPEELSRDGKLEEPGEKATRLAAVG